MLPSERISTLNSFFEEFVFSLKKEKKIERVFSIYQNDGLKKYIAVFFGQERKITTFIFFYEKNLK